MTKRVRTLSIDDLEKPTARLKLTPRVKPYWHKIVTGIALGYRAGPGSWNVRTANGKGGNYIQIIGHADDRETANGNTVLTYDAGARPRAAAGARRRRRRSARRQAAGHGRRGAASTTAGDLLKRRPTSGNASHPRYHLTPGLLDEAGHPAERARAVGMAERPAGERRSRPRPSTGAATR